MDVVSRYSFKDATFGDFVVGKEDADGIIAISTTSSVCVLAFLMIIVTPFSIFVGFF